MASPPTIINNPVTDQPVALWRPACAVIGLFFSTSIRGLIDPVAGAHFFGLKQAGRAESVFYRGLAGRNISMSICIFTFIATGQRRALGTFLCSFTFAAFADLWLVLTAPGVPGAFILFHLAKPFILGIAGTKLLDYW